MSPKPLFRLLPLLSLLAACNAGPTGESFAPKAARDGFHANAAASIRITSYATQIPIGSCPRFTATVFDYNGNPTPATVGWYRLSLTATYFQNAHSTSSGGTIEVCGADNLFQTISADACDLQGYCTANTDRVDIDVGDPIVSVSLNPRPIAVEVGKTVTVTASPSDRVGVRRPPRPASWSSTNSNVASVSSGVVRGVSIGTATINGTLANPSGNTVTGSAAVTVSTTGVVPGFFVTAITGIPQPITAAGSYSGTAQVTGGTATSTSWQVTYSNGVLPPIDTGFIPGAAYALSVPAGSYNIRITVTPKGIFGVGSPSIFDFPVCTTGGGGGGQLAAPHGDFSVTPYAKAGC